VFHPADAALYAVSARKAPAGKISLYGVEGDGAGQWKDVGFDAFNSGYRVVDEDEGIAIRNLVPANVPVGDIRVVNILFPIALLSNAVISVGESFPTPSTIDPNKLAEQRQGMLEGTLSAVVFATEAIDMAGAAYDAIRIGENALTLIRKTALQMLVYLNGILKTISQSADLAAVQSAVAIAEAFMAQAPLWGLYLDRAYLWTQSSDLSEMTDTIREARRVDGVMVAILGAVEKQKDFLLKNGISPEQMAEAKAYAETVLRNANAKDLDAQNRVGSYLARVKMSEKGLQRAKFTTGKYLDVNAGKINNLIEGKSSVTNGNASLGDYFIGVLGAGRVRRVSPEQLDVSRLMRAVASEGIKSGRVVPDTLAPLAIGVIKRVLEFATGPMNSLAQAAKTAWKAGIKEADISAVVAAIKKVRDDAYEELEKEKGAGIPDQTKIKDLEKRFAEAEVPLRIAQMDSTLLEPIHVHRFLAARNAHDAIVKRFDSTYEVETLHKALAEVAGYVFGQKDLKSISVDLETKEQQRALVDLMSDMQTAFGVSENVINTLTHKLVEGSVVFTPGESARRRSKQEVAEFLKTVYDTISADREAEFAKLASSLGPDLATSVRSYMENERDAESLIKNLEASPPDSRMKPEQIEAIKLFASPIGNFIKTNNFAKALEGELRWPDGILMEINGLITKLPAIVPSAEVKGILLKLNNAERRLSGLKAKISRRVPNPVATKDEKEKIDDLNVLIRDLRESYDVATGARSDYAAYQTLTRALSRHNEEIDARVNEAARVVADPTAPPDTKAAAAAVVAAAVPEAATVDATRDALDKALESPTSDPDLFEIISVKGKAETETGRASEDAAARLAAKQARDAAAASAGGAEPPGGTGDTTYQEGVSRPAPEENPGPARAALERTAVRGIGTGLKKTLVGLGAVAAIATLLGLGAALSGRATPDPKSTDPNVPPPASNVETALKIGGVVAGAALLLYLLFGRKPEPEKASAKLKR
jgi:hypothetical protein